MITILRWFLRLFYVFRAYNESVVKCSGPVLLLPNHVSWWDWVVVGVCLDDDWRFVTSSTTAELSWFHKVVMVNRRTFPVNVTSPYAVKHMAEYLQKGGRLVLFPEGRISTTGSLMKLFDGTGFLIFKTRPKVITAYLRGAEQLPLSRNPGKKRWFPRLSVHFSPVLEPPRFEGLSTTQARGRITEWLRDRMVRQNFDTEMEFGPATVPEAIVQAAREQPRKVILEDATFQKVSYRRLLLGAGLLADRWPSLGDAAHRRVGVLLPNVNAFPVTVLSLWAAGKVAAILNYSSGVPVMLACARVAGLRQIVTSRVFVERLKLKTEPFTEAGIEMVFLEDVRGRIGGARKLAAVVGQMVSPHLRVAAAGADDSAAVLFTSGSEGDPKAVELSHRNLLANVRQMVSVIDLMETDRFFNPLPLFHSFGLTVGLMLPLIRKVFTFLYVSPLHYRLVPAAVYDLNCTIFFGTNTFLNGYARKAHPYDFRSVRYLFAGAEKLQEATANLWMRKFGVRILEGYGATECSPCLAANLPMRLRQGAVGQFLPGIEFKLEPVAGVAEGGRLFVRGPNVMRGYLNPEPNARFRELGGWYDTGDIVHVDEEGYIFILGRLKRFAKVSGEMVSLTAIEEALAGAFPQYGLRFGAAIIAQPDEAKGEKLILVTNESKLGIDEVREAIRARGLGNLAVPREIKVLREIPKLGSGKINHRELERVLETESVPAAVTA